MIIFKKIQSKFGFTLLEWSLLLCLVCLIWAGAADLYRVAGGLFGS